MRQNLRTPGDSNSSAAIPVETLDSTGRAQRWVISVLEQHEARLTRYAQRITACPEMARDVVQYAFMRLCDQVSTNGKAKQGRESLSHQVDPQKHKDDDIRKRRPTPLIPQWLYAVCRNRAIDLVRKRDKMVRLDAAAEEFYLSPAASPDETAERKDAGAAVRCMMRDLPPAQQEVLDLWAEGFSYKEISEVTKRSEVNVRVMVHRAFTALREHPAAKEMLGERP